MTYLCTLWFSFVNAEGTIIWDYYYGETTPTEHEEAPEDTKVRNENEMKMCSVGMSQADLEALIELPIQPNGCEVILKNIIYLEFVSIT